MFKDNPYQNNIHKILMKALLMYMDEEVNLYNF